MNKKKLAVIITFAFILISAGVLFVYSKGDATKFKQVCLTLAGTFKSALLEGGQANIQEIHEIKYDSNDQPRFATYKNHIVKCTRQGIDFLDKNGKSSAFIPLAMNSPIIKKADPYLMVADIGGKDVVIFEDKQKKIEKKLEGNILNADISKSGYFCVVHEEKKYKGAVTLFNPEGMKQFTAGKAKNYILCAKVSPKGKYVVINVSDISGTKIGTVLEFVDSRGNLMASTVPHKDDIFPLVEYLNEEQVVAVGDSLILYFGKDREIKWQKSVEGRILSADFIYDNYIVVALEPKQGLKSFTHETSIVKMYNAKGDEKTEFEVDGKIVNMYIYEDCIAANTGREVYFTNKRGMLLGKYASPKNIEEVHFINSSEALIVTKSSIVIIKIN